MSMPKSGMGTRESLGQDRLPQGLSALQVRVDFSLDFADDRAAAVDFGDDPALFRKRRKRDGQRTAQLKS